MKLGGQVNAKDGNERELAYSECGAGTREVEGGRESKEEEGKRGKIVERKKRDLERKEGGGLRERDRREEERKRGKIAERRKKESGG